MNKNPLMATGALYLSVARTDVKGEVDVNCKI